MSFMTENTRSGGYGIMKMPTVHKRFVLMTLLTELPGGVGLEHELVIALMRVMAINTFAFLHRLMDKIFHGDEMTCLAEFFFGIC